MKISVIEPNYNGLILLKKNLPRLVTILENIRDHTFELLVVDDGSDDESVVFLTSFAQKFKSKNIRFIFINNTHNKGFSHTVNAGVKQSTGELIVLLNSDVVPKENFLETAIPHFKNQDMFAVGFMDESIEGDSVVYRGRGIGLWKRGFYIHSRGAVDKKDTSWVSGGSGIFRKSMFIMLGGFNEIYDPFYWEDIDLSYRAKKKGYQLMFEPKSVVVHEHTKGAILTKFSKEDITKISYRNQFLFVWNNATADQLLTHFLWLPTHFVKAIKRNDILFFAGFFNALIRKIVFAQN